MPPFVPIPDQCSSALCRTKENINLQKIKMNVPLIVSNSVQTALNSLLAFSVLRTATSPSSCPAFRGFPDLPCPQRHLQSRGDSKFSWSHSSHPPPRPPGQAHPSLLCLLKDTSVRVTFWGAAYVCSAILAKPREEASLKQRWRV